MRPGSELIGLLESEMPMSDEYQPAIILALIQEPGFTLPGGDLPGENVSPNSSVWWVNQGAAFDHELSGGYVWAPQKSKAGVALEHHTNVSRVRQGDVIVHYAGG